MPARTVPQETVAGWLDTLLADPALHAVAQSIDDFWAETTPQLADPALACPAAHRAMLERRDRELAQFRETERYSRVLRRIAGAPAWR